MVGIPGIDSTEDSPKGASADAFAVFVIAVGAGGVTGMDEGWSGIPGGAGTPGTAEKENNSLEDGIDAVPGYIAFSAGAEGVDMPTMLVAG